MSLICKAPRYCNCPFWDFGKTCPECNEDCPELVERYDLRPCDCGADVVLYNEGVARNRIRRSCDDYLAITTPSGWHRNHGFFVECPTCGRRTDPCRIAARAVDLWNNRQDIKVSSKVITLCGSSRFKDAFMDAQKRLTLQGHIVLSLGLFGHSGDNEAEYAKDMLDALHKRKIMMSDEIFVINPGGYIGESTANEIAFAERMGKIVRYLEDRTTPGP